MELVKIVLSWPVIFLCLTVIFRDELKKMLKIIEKVVIKHGNTEIALESSAIATQQAANKNTASAEESYVVKRLLTEQKRSVRKINNKQKQNDSLKVELAEKNKVLDQAIQYLEYEKIYNVIFGTQIKLLLVLRNTTLGLESAQLQEFFLSYRRFATVSASFTNIETYLGFLKTNNLITIQDNQIKITEKGTRFVEYITQQGYPIEKLL